MKALISRGSWITCYFLYIVYLSLRPLLHSIDYTVQWVGFGYFNVLCGLLSRRPRSYSICITVGSYQSHFQFVSQAIDVTDLVQHTCPQSQYSSMHLPAKFKYSSLCSPTLPTVGYSLTGSKCPVWAPSLAMYIEWKFAVEYTMWKTWLFPPKLQNSLSC